MPTWQDDWDALTETKLARVDDFLVRNISVTTADADGTVERASVTLLSQAILDLVDVRDYGAVGDGSTDDLTALDNAVTAAGTLGMRGVWLPHTPSGYAVSDTWSIPETIDVLQEAPVIYTGSSDVTCIEIGVTAEIAFQRTYRLWAIRDSISDWTDPACIGIDLINPNQCKVEIVGVQGFTVGLKVHGLSSAADTGAVWSTFHLYYFVDNGCDVDLVSDGTGGFVNQNTFIGGSFNASSNEPNDTQDKIGVRLQMVNSADSLPNNNTFINPSFEFHFDTRSGDCIPIHILDGRYNRFIQCRHESNDVLFMQVEGNSWDNHASIAYTEQTSFSGLLVDTSTGYNVVTVLENENRQARAAFYQPALTFATPTAWDVYGAPRAALTMTGDATINVSDSGTINTFNGRYTLRVIQDGTGGRVLTFGTGFSNVPATALLKTAASAVTVLEFVGNGSTLVLIEPRAAVGQIHLTATDRLVGRSTAGAGVAEEITCTAAGRAILDDADAAAQRATLGLVIGTNVQAYHTELDALIAAFTPASSSGPTTIAFAEDTDNGAHTVTLSAPSSIAGNVTVTLQAVSGQVYSSNGTDVAVADGGTGASDASGARTNLGLVIGTDVAPVNNAVFTGTFTAPNGSISYAEIQDVSATDRLLGRDTAAAGDIEELTVGGGIEFTGSGGIQRSALTGDITASAGSNSTALADGAVTDAKLRDSAALSVIGRSANSSGDPADIAAANDGEVLRRSGTAVGFGTIATAGIANDAVTYAKIQNVSATDRLLGRSTAGAGDIEEITCTAAGRALIDDADAAAQRTTLAALGTGGGTMTGALEGGGQTLGGFLGKVVTSVSGTLVAATHSGNILVTSGNITVPTTAGFSGTVIFGGAHTITFNSTTSAAMASGDIVTFVVQSSTVIKASRIPAAALVTFS